MQAPVIERIEQATSLPPAWDECAKNYFQRREFLQHTDQFNPCRQRYYLVWEGEQLIAGACVYNLSIHLFTFSNIPSKISMTVMGIPASISASGIFGKTIADQELLIRHILKHEKGLLLGLNLSPDLHSDPAIDMTMMPTVVMEHNFDSLSEYTSTLRSNYRRRINQLIKAFKGVENTKTNCLIFSEKHYELYQQIMLRTKNKLEILSLDYFKNLPENFYLTSYYHKGKLLCWHINCIDGNKLFFFFGGHDYRLLPAYQSYFNNLFGILKEAIEEGYQYIDFGQTAELAKMKTGGQISEKRLFLYHRNSLFRRFISICKPLIAYRLPKAIVHPLKQNDQVYQNKNGSHENTLRKTATIS